MRLYSWNVNGIRAAGKKGFFEWLLRTQPDVVCIQETKAFRGDLTPDWIAPDGYASEWQSAKRPGYSGVAVYFKKGHVPLAVDPMGIAEFDDEGRVQVIRYPEFVLVNAYYPNSQPERKRLDYKLRFCTAMTRMCNRFRRRGSHVVVCGDLNVAHKEIDLARPSENVDNPGFYPEERARLDRFEGAGYVDVFRQFEKRPGHYSWWSYRTNARERNIGWRLDYHWVNREFLLQVKGAAIHPDVLGSDHCPVSLTVRCGG